MRKLPPVRVHYPCVEVRPDVLNGSPIVRGTRVPVRRIWDWHRKGVSVETLVQRYPTVGWEGILCALAFGYANEDLVEADLEREREIWAHERPPPRVPIIPGVSLGPPRRTSTTAPSPERSRDR